MKPHPKIFKMLKIIEIVGNTGIIEIFEISEIVGVSYQAVFNSSHPRPLQPHTQSQWHTHSCPAISWKSLPHPIGYSKSWHRSSREHCPPHPIRSSSRHGHLEVVLKGEEDEVEEDEEEEEGKGEDEEGWRWALVWWEGNVH